jgi:cytochrome c oxidase cbb3-type subunit 1
MLWMPSWGGMINGLMTLSGAGTSSAPTRSCADGGVGRLLRHGDLRGPADVGEGGQLSPTTPTGPSAVHSGALGWVAYISFGAIYCLVPWLWNSKVSTAPPVNWHFDLEPRHRLITSMWVAGILQELMAPPGSASSNTLHRDVEAMHPSI